MKAITEDYLRLELRNTQPEIYYIPTGKLLTPAAREYLQQRKIKIAKEADRPSAPAPRIVDTPVPAAQEPAPPAAKPKYVDHETGAFYMEKPEHMTHLNGDFLVVKDHPRIIFRGKLDTLESELILCQLTDKGLEAPVGEILELARRIIRCEVLDEPLQWDRLCGLTEDEQRKRSHFPQDYYGQPHFMPSAADGAAIARLNRARCAAREAELAAVTAFRDREGNPTRVDILRAMNRMSSMLYLLMIGKRADAGRGKER